MTGPCIDRAGSALRGVAALLCLWLGAVSGPLQAQSLRAAGAPPSITLTDDRGRAQTLAAPPLRIVSLLPSLTEGVCALGGCDRLVGTDRYSNSPERVKTLPKLGGIEDANLERIVALKPDVVLAAPSARVVERLESLGLQVLVLESKTHADVQHSLEVLAAMLGVLTEEGYPVRDMGVLEAPEGQGEAAPLLLSGKVCPECGNPNVIHKDGCDFCTACGYVGQCG